MPNYFIINGKAYPPPDTIHMRFGQTVKLRFIGADNTFVLPRQVRGGLPGGRRRC